MKNVGNNVNPNFGQMCPDIVHQGYLIHNPYKALSFSLTFFSLQGEHCKRLLITVLADMF